MKTLTRDAIRARDKTRDSVVLELPEMGEGVQVRLRPAPASVAFAIGDLDDSGRNHQSLPLIAAGSLVDDDGNRLYSLSDADLAEIAEEFPFPALTRIAERALGLSGLAAADPDAAAKN